MSSELATDRSPAAWFERRVPVVAMVTVVVGLLAVSFLIPSDVDSVPSNHAKALKIVRAVALHPLRARVGFFVIVAFLALLAPAIRPLRRFAVTRGAGCTEVGYRLIAVGSIAGAVGNAFAPLTLPSTVGLDENTMASYVVANGGGTASTVILAFYALLPVGAIVLLVGLLRSATLPWWQPVALCVGLFGLMPSPAGVLTLIEGVLLAVAFATMGRDALRVNRS